MAYSRPTLVLFQGRALPSASHLERLVMDAQDASTLDLLLAASASQAFDRAILVTEDNSLANAASGLSLQLPLSIEAANTEPFIFGEALQQVCRLHNLERVVYAGGGSMPLATPDILADLALAVSGAGECVVTNNLFSADITAFYPASALQKIGPARNDNDLAWLLHFKAGLPHAATPRNLATNFDIDTPADIATLFLATQSPPLKDSLGPHLSSSLDRVSTSTPALTHVMERAYTVMSARRSHLLLAGRVSSWTWRRLETNLPCQTRIFSEERGMRASGREARGEVRSLLGLYADIAGITGLISALEQTSDAAFLDTRVLFAHRRLSPHRRDRFASDALSPGEISDPWIRELTEAASHSSIPIILGGHSLISGGVWAISERVRGSASATN